jgi:hypothetical protein
MTLLPDEAVRIAIASSDTSGNLTIGPAATIGAQGNIYQVTLDYISADTKSIPVFLDATVSNKPAVVASGGAVAEQPTYRISQDPNSSVWASYTKELFEGKVAAPQAALLGRRRVVFPVYVGVGLRLVATVRVLKGNVNLASLGAITASVAAGEATGSLVVQTLGISGPKVSTIMPLPSDLNQTTVQNAILALGSIKAILYDHETSVVPRVVGIYNPIGGGAAVVNQIVSILANDKIVMGFCEHDTNNSNGSVKAQPAAAPRIAPPPPATAPQEIPAARNLQTPASAHGKRSGPGSN